MAEGPYKSLLVVLLDLALVKRGLVLMRGQNYWRIENAASQARREAASGSEEARRYLSDPRFFWTKDPSGKVVVIEHVGDEDIPYAVEPGSKVSV